MKTNNKLLTCYFTCWRWNQLVVMQDAVMNTWLAALCYWRHPKDLVKLFRLTMNPPVVPKWTQKHWYVTSGCVYDTWLERKESGREREQFREREGEKEKEWGKGKDQLLTWGCVTADTVSASRLMLTWLWPLTIWFWKSLSIYEVWYEIRRKLVTTC